MSIKAIYNESNDKDIYEKFNNQMINALQFSKEEKLTINLPFIYDLLHYASVYIKENNIIKYRFGSLSHQNIESVLQHASIINPFNLKIYVTIIRKRIHF